MTSGCFFALVATAFVLSQPAKVSAQSASPSVGCIEALENKPKISLAEVMSCMKKIANENDVLRNQVAVPAGTVVAFNRQASDPCPSGWNSFELAGGRFIIGAGGYEQKDENGTRLINHQVGITGGEIAHKLKKEELPNHFHEIDPPEIIIEGAQAGQSGIKVVTIDGENRNIGQDKTRVFRDPGTGDGDPHNNIPPFVALYYCIKLDKQASTP